MFDEAFLLVLGLGEDATPLYVHIMRERRLAGCPIAAGDAEVAAIARYTGAPIATDRPHAFAGCAVRVIDPWQPIASAATRETGSANGPSSSSGS